METLNYDVWLKILQTLGESSVISVLNFSETCSAAYNLVKSNEKLIFKRQKPVLIAFEARMGRDEKSHFNIWIDNQLVVLEQNNLLKHFGQKNQVRWWEKRVKVAYSEPLPERQKKLYFNFPRKARNMLYETDGGCPKTYRISFLDANAELQCEFFGQNLREFKRLACLYAIICFSSKITWLFKERQEFLDLILAPTSPFFLVMTTIRYSFLEETFERVEELLLQLKAAKTIPKHRTITFWANDTDIYRMFFRYEGLHHARMMAQGNRLKQKMGVAVNEWAGKNNVIQEYKFNAGSVFLDLNITDERFVFGTQVLQLTTDEENAEFSTAKCPWTIAI